MIAKQSENIMCYEKTQKKEWGQIVLFKYIEKSKCYKVPWNFSFNKERTLETLKILSFSIELYLLPSSPPHPVALVLKPVCTGGCELAQHC